jgi:hypothetical protein
MPKKKKPDDNLSKHSWPSEEEDSWEKGMEKAYKNSDIFQKLRVTSFFQRILKRLGLSGI